MKEIPVGDNGLVALVDDEDHPLLSRFRWNERMGNSRTIYATATLSFSRNEATIAGAPGPRVIPMHRLVMPCPRLRFIDHRDGNGLNNQKANLRVCTRMQNAANTQKRNPQATSRYKGVYYHRTRGCWRAKLKKDDKVVLCREFHDEVEAAKAYDAKAREVLGKFARVNFPTEDEMPAIR